MAIKPEILEATRVELGEKPCSRCGVTKTLDLFGSWGKQRPGKLKAQCKTCLSEMRRDWHANNLDAAHQNNAKWLAENAEKRKVYAAKYKRAYQQRLGETLRREQRHAYSLNPEIYKSRASAWAVANQAKVSEMSRNYYTQNSEELKRRTRAWAIKNPEKQSIQRVKRRKAQQLVSWASPEAVRRVYKEAQRLTSETGQLHVVDHIYPLAGKKVSGLHTHNNLRVVTYSLNARKSAKLPGICSSELWDPQGADVFQEASNG